MEFHRSFLAPSRTTNASPSRPRDDWVWTLEPHQHLAGIGTAEQAEKGVERGFDAVSRSTEAALGFECSPLSCSYLAVEVPTNEFCLFPSRDAAATAAQSFSTGQAEPGDYYVIQVLELTGVSESS